jgi:hypothetical protein
MRNKSRLMVVIPVLLSLVLSQTGCRASDTTPTSTLTWQVEVSKVEIKDSLNAVESVTQYDGSKIDVVHTQNPATGDVYLIMEVTIRKTDNQSAIPFDWSQLVVVDSSGNSHHRLDNDTFLEYFQYSPRITGLELRFGETAGWMGYEIPASTAKGKLTLSYTAEGSQQDLTLQK